MRPSISIAAQKEGRREPEPAAPRLVDDPALSEWRRSASAMNARGAPICTKGTLVFSKLAAEIADVELVEHVGDVELEIGVVVETRRSRAADAHADIDRRIGRRTWRGDRHCRRRRRSRRNGYLVVDVARTGPLRLDAELQRPELGLDAAAERIDRRARFAAAGGRAQDWAGSGLAAEQSALTVACIRRSMHVVLDFDHR